MVQIINVNAYSVASLPLIPRAHGNSLASATGFVVRHNQEAYLVTNWHVVAGRDPRTGQSKDKTGAVPDTLTATFTRKLAPAQLEWIDVDLKLSDDEGVPIWLEHPRHGRRVDVVALKLEPDSARQLLPYKLTADTQTKLEVARRLNIIGFPFGMASSGACAIWLQGYVASDPEIDYDDLPCFLIDARTRQGQSGSPVISYYHGGETVPLIDGDWQEGPEPVAELQGVYSGRINEESDIGIVWKREVIQEIIESRVRGNNDFMGG
ncbi:MAG TPA: serine protease [Candidatus Saccharimonadales bacterium]|nr:serine protease [Candidatus Saccharimonadales bacterium]